MSIRGLRTFFIDLSMVLCLATVSIFVIYKQASTDILWLLGAAYTGIATKQYVGKKAQGEQQLAQLKVKNGNANG